MNLQINTKNGIEITDEIKDIIQKKFIDKLDLLMEHFNDEMKIADLHLEFDKKYKIYKTRFDIALPGPHGKIFSETSHHELIAALVDLREQIEKQIKRYKSELNKHTSE
jgi:ribosomal subunit interface protein